MQQTLDLALELNTEMANMYPCLALPGSPMYRPGHRNGWKLPDSYAGYGFLSYECEPLATRHVSAAEVLRFRDDAWRRYFSDPKYLALVQTKFGSQERENIEDMASIRLKRRVLATEVLHGPELQATGSNRLKAACGVHEAEVAAAMRKVSLGHFAQRRQPAALEHLVVYLLHERFGARQEGRVPVADPALGSSRWTIARTPRRVSTLSAIGPVYSS